MGGNRRLRFRMVTLLSKSQVETTDSRRCARRKWRIRVMDHPNAAGLEISFRQVRYHPPAQLSTCKRGRIFRNYYRRILLTSSSHSRCAICDSLSVKLDRIHESAKVSATLLARISASSSGNSACPRFASPGIQSASGDAFRIKLPCCIIAPRRRL